jgi:hypothetical protein
LFPITEYNQNRLWLGAKGKKEKKMSKKKLSTLTIKSVIAALLSVVVGCSQPQQKTKLADLNLGMQIFEVREVHKKELVPLAFESRQGFDLAQYQGRFYNGEQSKPYKLTFEIYSPLTKIQCQYVAAKNNVTEPNEITRIMALEGYRPNRLIKVEEDTILIESEARQAQTNKPSFGSNLGNFIRTVGLAAENVDASQPWQRGYEGPLHREQARQDDEKLRQAYLKRLDDSNHPLTQADIALLEQIQNQQYQQQYLKHLKRMEEMKEQEILNRPTHIRPDGLGGYIVD